MRYVDGVEMTPARKAFQRGMNLTMDQGPNRNPEAAQGYFQKAYRLGQGQLSGSEMDRIQQKAMDTRMNNMSLRAGTQVPYYASERDPKTGAFIPPEKQIAAGGGQMSISARTPSKREKLPSVSQSTLQDASVPSSSVSYPPENKFFPVDKGNADFDKILDSSSSQKQADRVLTDLSKPLPSSSSQSLPSLSDSLNRSFMDSLKNDVGAFVYGVPAQPELRNQVQSQIVDDFVQGLNPANVMSQVPTVVGRSTGGAIKTGEDAMPSPSDTTSQDRKASRDAAMAAAARSQNAAATTSPPVSPSPSSATPVAPPPSPAYSSGFPSRSTQPFDATEDRNRRMSEQQRLLNQRMAAVGGDPSRSSLGVQPAPAPIGSSSLIQTNPSTGRSKVAFNTYRSNDGRFSRNAQVLGIDGSDALMQYEDGRRNRVPLNRLDEASREQAIQTAALLGFSRGSDMTDLEGNRMPVSPTDSLNRLFGSRDRNELYSSTTGELTAGDPQAYRNQQAFNSAYGIAPPENPAINESLVAQSGRNARNRLARATQPGGLPDIPDEDPNRPLLAPRGSAYYNPDDPRNRRSFVPLGDVDAGQQIVNQGDTSGIARYSPVTRRTMIASDGSPVNAVIGGNSAIDNNGNVVPVERDSNGLPSAVSGSGGSTMAFDVNPNVASVGSRKRYALDSQGRPIPGSAINISDRTRRELRQNPDYASMDGSQQDRFDSLLAKNAADYAERKAEREKRADEIRSLAGGLGPGMGQRTSAARQELARNRMEQERDDLLRSQQQEREDELRRQQYSREDAVSEAQFERDRELLEMKGKQELDRARVAAEIEAKRADRDKKDAITDALASQGDPAARRTQREEAGIEEQNREINILQEEGMLPPTPAYVSPVAYGNIPVDQKNSILSYLDGIAYSNLPEETKRREWKRLAGSREQFNSLIEDSSFAEGFSYNNYENDMFGLYGRFVGE
jgi:hypothetical protein